MEHVFKIMDERSDSSLPRGLGWSAGQAEWLRYSFSMPVCQTFDMEKHIQAVNTTGEVRKNEAYISFLLLHMSSTVEYKSIYRRFQGRH